jgi:hypothetical protein
MCHCAQHTFYFFHGSLQSISYSVVMDYIFTCISYSTLSFGLTFIFNSCIHLRYKTQTFSCSSSFFPLLLWWVGYIMAFTQVLAMFRMYHTWIHLLHHHHFVFSLSRKSFSSLPVIMSNRNPYMVNPPS